MKFYMQVTCALLVLKIIVSADRDHPLGPADITVERVVECEHPENFQKPLIFMMKKFNRTHAGFTGCFEFDSDLGSDSSIEIKAAKWGDGGWKPNALNVVQKDACETLNKFVKDPWKALLKATGIENHPCPIPPGNHCFENLYMPLDGLFKKMLYGKFRIDSTFLINNEPILCIRAYILSEPSKLN